jgi:S-adenosylmethionine decarboxylase
MGQHFLLNIYDVDRFLLEERDSFVEFIRPLLHDCMANVLDDCSHHFSPLPNGDPGGFTYLALLSTSHFSIHTWPENNCAALDMFTCGDIQVESLKHNIIKYFAPKTYDLKKLTR